MRKALLTISALALGLAGCATQPDNGSRIQVSDQSMSREREPASSYTVETGDTLYGIAWRHNMDFRDLARLNDIGPPYRLQPGQELQLDDSGNQGGASRATSDSTGQQAQTSPATQVSGVIDVDSEGENPDWLSPDESAIERNRQMSSRAQEESGTSGEALGAAAVTGGYGSVQQDSNGETRMAPGPIFNYDSPGADGRLSERDIAEREEIAAARQAETQRQAEAQRQEETTRQVEGAAVQAAAQSQSAAASQPEQQEQEQQQAQTDANAETQPSSTPSDTEQTSGQDAGTAVAGESQSSGASSDRSYTPVDEVPWQWPADGELVGRFGEGSTITAGIDIGGQKGQPVKAAGPGIVVYAGSGVRGYGNLILLKHNDQFLSAYAHNDSLRVKENDVVEAGEQIATMGDTDSDSVKLHFEVRRDGQPQDPLEYLPSR